MERAQLDRYRQQLEQLADRVGRTAAALENGVRMPLGGEAGGGMSNAPLHLGDLGTETYSQELDATLLENETYLRNEAVEALDRIDAGTYGRCVACGGDIGEPRLDALPYVRHCVRCAAAEQSGLAVNLNDGRPAGWLGGPGHEGDTAASRRAVGRDLGHDPDDTHAAGTPGGGSAAGGLAGTNVGGGAPANADLQGAMGSGNFDRDEDDEDDEDDDLPAEGGASGGAVGGTPANKRATGQAAKPRRRTKRADP